MTYMLELFCSTVDLRTKKDALARAVERYNEKTYSMQNPKTLNICDISEKYIIVELESSLPLAAPGKALRTFSMDLIKEEGFEPSPSGQLFRTRLISQGGVPEKEEKAARSVTDITDAEFLKALIDYTMSKSAGSITEYRQKRGALQKMKQIALESGIIE